MCVHVSLDILYTICLMWYTRFVSDCIIVSIVIDIISICRQYDINYEGLHLHIYIYIYIVECCRNYNFASCLDHTGCDSAIVKRKGFHFNYLKIGLIFV